MITGRKAANIVLAALVKELHQAQMEILLCERFGADYVSPTSARLGYAPPNHTQHAALVCEHAGLLADVKALKAAIDAASDQNVADFVDALIRRNTKRHQL